MPNKPKNTGQLIEKGMCWEEVFYHKAMVGDEWRDAEIPITQFFVCVAVDEKGATVLSWSADDLMGRPEWSTLETNEIRIPKDTKVTRKIGIHDLHQLVFGEKSAAT